MSDAAALARALAPRVRDLLPSLTDDLVRLARVPSVSAPGYDAAQVVRSAMLAAELLAAAGAEVRVLERPGAHPAVVGRVAGPKGSPTVLLYAHHDVQPPGPEASWTTPAFEPTVRGGRLFGRGVSDDKNGVMAHVAALRAHGHDSPVNVVVFLEGEEESGSLHLREFLEAERALLRADAVVIADSENWRSGQPALTTSLRGSVNCVVEVRTLDHAVHSGGYGGVAPDALMALARVLATLHDDRGSVAVAGIPRADAGALDLTDDEVRGYVGARPGLELIGVGTLTSRLWRQPSISIIGIDAPTVRESSNQLVPVARARVSLRVPPGFDANEALRLLVGHLRAQRPWGADVSVTPGTAGQPFSPRSDGPAYAAMRAALAAAWGRAPIDIGQGGTIPFLHDFAEVFPKAELLVTGAGAGPDSNPHSENESLELGEFEKACLAEAAFLVLMGSR